MGRGEKDLMGAMAKRKSSLWGGGRVSKRTHCVRLSKERNEWDSIREKRTHLAKTVMNNANRPPL